MSETDHELNIPYVICRMHDIPSKRAVGVQLMRAGAAGAAEPWPIIVVRWGKHVFGYVNSCPHANTRLDWEADQFLDPTGMRLICGKHGALFDLASGDCIDGPCKGDSLEPVALLVLDDDICIVGAPLLEDDETPEDDTE